jgi:hypothetical protein
MFFDRQKYTVYVLPRNKEFRNKKSQKEFPLNTLEQIHPFKITEKNIIVKKYGKFIIALVFTEPVLEQANFSTFYVVEKCRGFSGSALFVSKEFIEVLIIQKGNLLRSCCEKDSSKLDELASKADRIFLPKGYPVFWTAGHKFKSSKIFFYNENINLTKNKKARFFLTCLVSLLILLFVFAAKISKVQNQHIERAKLEAIRKADEISLKKETALNKEAERLYKEYVSLFESIPVEPYDVCAQVYNCLLPGVKIISLSIENDSFTTELSGKESAKVLERFENNLKFSDCLILRTSFENNYESFNITGNVKKFLLPCASEESQNRIDFYNKEISKLREKINAHKSQSFSECTKEIQELAEIKNCSLKYIQSINNSDVIDIELSSNGRAENILGYIKALSNSYLIGLLRLKNLSADNNISCTLTILTGISFVKNDTLPNESEIETKPEQIAKAFNQSVSKSRVVKKNKTSVEEKITGDRPIQKAPFLVFIGFAKLSDNKKAVIIKDTRNEDIYKIENFSKENEKLYVEYENNIYEVKK